MTKSSSASQLKECTIEELVLGTNVIIKSILLDRHKKTKTIWFHLYKVSKVVKFKDT